MGEKAASGVQNHHRPLNRLVLNIPFAPRQVGVVCAALAPEAHNPGQKSTVRFRAEEGMLQVTVNAEGLASLRAAVNTYIRWIQLSAALMQEH